VRLVSHRLGLVGIADVVEFHPNSDGIKTVYPVEYKRGRRRRWDNDDVQLCAQAICLEEMLGSSISRGAIYHIRSHQRREILLDEKLRQKTEHAAARLHELIASRITPPPVYHKKCEQCSLIDLCLPKAPRPRATASRYLVQVIDDHLSEQASSEP
jgi:CRISPR-associated exonuclease Cas4